MTPLSAVMPGDSGTVKKVGGSSESRQFLENLGFVPGTSVRVITKMSGNVIVAVMESRVAISREMASRIMV